MYVCIHIYIYVYASLYQKHGTMILETVEAISGARMTGLDVGDGQELPGAEAANLEVGLEIEERSP